MKNKLIELVMVFKTDKGILTRRLVGEDAETWNNEVNSACMMDAIRSPMKNYPTLSWKETLQPSREEPDYAG